MRGRSIMSNEFKWLHHKLEEGAFSAFEKICFDIFDEDYKNASVEKRHNGSLCMS